MKSHTLEVAGQKIALKTDAAEAQVRRLADAVNQRVKSIRAAAPTAPVATVLALTAIQLADDLAELEERVVRERREAAAEVKQSARLLAKGAEAAESWLRETGGEPAADS